MSNANKDLPSTTTMVRNHGGERSGALISTVDENELITKKINEMLNITEIKGGWVNE